MVNYISHNQPMYIKFSARHLADAEETKSEKTLNVSYSGMSAYASTAGSEAELSPRSEVGDAFSSQLNTILEKGESQYEPHQHLYTDDEVDNLRAKLEDKSREIAAEGDKIQAVMNKADGVMRICEEVDAMIEKSRK